MMNSKEVRKMLYTEDGIMDRLRNTNEGVTSEEKAMLLNFADDVGKCIQEQGKDMTEEVILLLDAIFTLGVTAESEEMRDLAILIYDKLVRNIDSLGYYED